MNGSPSRRRLRVLAVSSAGGHWLQLCRMAPAWSDEEVVTACTAPGPAMPVRVRRHHALPDATRWDRMRLLALALRVALVVARERPDVVISTGAAPGLFALMWGRLFGARTVWVDSLANVETLSAAGRAARWLAHDWLTQWPHLAEPPRPVPPLRGWIHSLRSTPRFRGSVW